MSTPRPPLPPFTEETARQKVQLAEDAWNSRDPERVSLFLMDYPHRERLKILGHARVLDARKNAALADQLTPTPELRSKIERLFLIEVASFDWNCPQYITPRYTEAEVAAHTAPLKARIAELEAKLAGH